MRTRHLTLHGTSREGDAIDVLGRQDETLRSLFADWENTEPPWGEGPDSVVPKSWDNGTIGKLIVEHTAVALAAREDVARALEASSKVELARSVRTQAAQMRVLLDRLDETAQGLGPLEVARNPAFAETVRALRSVVEHSSSEPSTAPEPDRIATALEDRRGDLQSARYLRKHAPTHPGKNRWFSNVPVFVRMHAAWDRVRGLPWAESSPTANPEIAEKYNQDLDSG